MVNGAINEAVLLRVVSSLDSGGIWQLPAGQAEHLAVAEIKTWMSVCELNVSFLRASKMIFGQPGKD